MNINLEKPSFKKLCFLNMQRLTNFPYIEADFDALTNYEMLCKVVEYLNNVIANQNTTNDAVEELYDAFTTLKDYVDNYFTNLDVQDEINQKLDEMANNGSLTNLIKGYVNPFIEEQNDKINMIDNKVNAVASASPLVASSISEMTDTTRTYVLTTNGNWYYYNGTEWVVGGLYQSSGIADNSIKYNMLENNLKNNIKISDLETSDYTISGTYYKGNVGSQISTSTLENGRSGILNVSKDDLIYIPFIDDIPNFGSIPAILITDNEDIILSKYTKADLINAIFPNNTPLILRMPDNASKLYFNNNLIDNSTVHESIWYPFKIKSYNYNDERINYNLSVKETINYTEIINDTIYSLTNSNRVLNGYNTYIYDVNPLEKININTRIPGAVQFLLAIFYDNNGKRTGFSLPRGINNTPQDMDVDVIVPSGSYKMYLCVINTYIPLVSKYVFNSGENISKKLNVTYNDGTLSINNNENENSLTFSHFGGNNLFMIKSYKVGGITKILTTDMIPAPYIVRAVNNADGDKTSSIFTGGNHQWNNQGSGSTPTARETNLNIYCDDKLINEGESISCNSVKIIETNRVQAWNTVKENGTGREILEEKIVFNFDGKDLKVLNTITPLEEIIIERYYGIQTSGVSNNEYLIYADKVYNVNTQYNLTEKPYKIFGGNIISSSLKNEGLGKYNYNNSSTNKVNISNGKSYFVPIYNNNISFTPNDINYIEGEYIFDINQK